MNLTIFYSWQETTNRVFNKDFIRTCIEDALKNIENTGQLKGVLFKVQESTNNLGGTPNIPDTIEQRTRDCDIFIGDLSVVNSFSNLEKFIRKIRKKKLQYFINNNVYGEFNRALAELDFQQVISVMNIAYGDPEDDSLLIPFDTRHRRNPITYNLKNLKNFESEHSKFVSILENALRKSALVAIDNLKIKYKPFIRFTEHLKEPKNQERFFENDFIKDVKQKIIDNKKNIRLIGLSGLGKTRIVIEAFREPQDFMLSYLYCDAYLDDFFSIQAAVEKINNDKEKAYIVIDNCTEEQLNKILILKSRIQCQLPLITIYNQPEEIESDKCFYIRVPKSMNDIVDKILDKEAKKINKEILPIIKEFSGGIPLMAKLLVKSINEGEEYVGRLGNIDLLSKILNTEKESNERKILRSCSIFDFIGIEDDVREHLKFIATNKNITPVDGIDSVIISEFDGVIAKYSKREIFERKGRLISIRPKTLALFLATEWFELCSQERLENLFADIQKHNSSKVLIESLCKQIQYLGYNDNAKKLFQKLLDFNGPFDNAKVVNTELGSRLFRSFVEVNPIAVADNLYRLFGSMSIDELNSVDDGRRNLVWTLEKLCFDSSTFEKGAKLMMSFAVAENETWGNNATAEFLRLFKILLPGTQASLLERLKILRWGLDKNDNYKELAIKAIDSAFQAQGFTYFSGAEKQGTKKLEHYQPSSEEIREYWSSLLSLLKAEILSGTKYIEHSCKILSQNLRGFVRFGAFDLMLPVIEEIITYKNNDWDEMQDSLYNVLNYDTDYINPQTKETILRLIEVLTKDDFISRFLEIKKNRKRGKAEISYQDNIKQQQELYSKLAIEFVEKEYYSIDVLRAIYAENDSFSNPFGSTIAELIKDDFEKNELFINYSIEALNALSKYNPSILIDYSKKLNESGIKYLVNILKENSNLSYLLFPILGVRCTEFDKLSILLTLVDNNPTLVGNFKTFFNYHIITVEYDTKIAELLERIRNYNTDGLNTAISITSSILFFNKDVSQYVAILDFAEKTIERISFNANKELLTDDLFQLILHQLEKSNRLDLAVYVNNEMISISNDTSISFSFNYNFQKLYSVLLDKYFDAIWNDLSNALLSKDADYMRFYNFKGLLGAHIGSVSHSENILFKEKNFEKLLNWCEENSELAPERLASMIPIYLDKGFHPLVIYLLDKYGDNHNMLDSLSANMGSFSWSGSVIPLYEQKIEALESLIPHKNRTVEEWAKQKIEWTKKDIEREQQREDEEKFFYS